MSIELGPFLCKPTSTSMGFWLMCKLENFEQTVTIRILDGSRTPIDMITLLPQPESKYGIQTGETKKLVANTTYFYEVQVEGLKIATDLNDHDFTFTTLPEDGRQAPMDFLLISCNGIDEFERTRKPESPENFNMWIQLERRLKDEPELRLGLLAGDQVYMDQDFEDIFSAAQKEDKTNAHSIIRSAYIRFWGHQSYRKIMARIPCLLMWDDHDVIDGFGSRLDQYNKNFEEELKWTNYRKVLTEAFYEFQAVRNPGNFSKDSKNFSLDYSWDDLNFILMDLRSYRNPFRAKQENTLIAPVHKSEISDRIDRAMNGGKKNFFFVTPVTVARMGEGIETIMGEAANYLWGSVRAFGWGDKGLSRFGRSFAWFTFFGIALSLMQFPLRDNFAFGSALSCMILGSVIFISDRFRSPLKTRRGEPLEFFKILSKKIPRSEVPFRAWLRLVSIVVFVIGLIGATCISWLGEPLAEISNTISKWSEVSVNEFKPVKFLLYFVAISAFVGSFWTSTKNPWKLKKTMLWGSVGISLIALTWLGMPGQELSFYIIVEFAAQLLVVFYLLMTILEAWAILHEVAGLDDDVKDAWSSAENKKELAWLYRQIMKAQAPEKNRSHILTGDIHTGGITKLFLGDGIEKPTYQVVSSPIGYVPMPGFVERLTGSDKPIKFEIGDGNFVEGINYFYNSSRNYVIMRSQVKDGTRNFVAEFEFENMKNLVSHSLDI